MKKYEMVFDSVNSENYAKPITVLVIQPDQIKSSTGAMLFTHGWGGNRFQHQDKMEYAVENHDVVAVSAEYRMSGFDFNPVTGAGAYRPYDASFMQTFDVLNAFRFVLDSLWGIDRSRLFHYGGSQGGHIALISAVFAPATFAFVYASCPITIFDEPRQELSGRRFAEHEISARSPVDHVERLRIPVFLEHGTADSTVPVEHSIEMERRLRAAGKEVRAVYYEGGEHSLQPTITKLDAFKAMAPEPLANAVNPETDDFRAGSLIEIPCSGRTLAIDWSRPADSVDLFEWR